jgi:hypothetical protein
MCDLRACCNYVNYALAYNMSQLSQKLYQCEGILVRQNVQFGIAELRKLTMLMFGGWGSFCLTSEARAETTKYASSARHPCCTDLML